MAVPHWPCPEAAPCPGCAAAVRPATGAAPGCRCNAPGCRTGARHPGSAARCATRFPRAARDTGTNHDQARPADRLRSAATYSAPADGSDRIAARGAVRPPPVPRAPVRASRWRRWSAAAPLPASREPAAPARQPAAEVARVSGQAPCSAAAAPAVPRCHHSARAVHRQPAEPPPPRRRRPASRGKRCARPCVGSRAAWWDDTDRGSAGLAGNDVGAVGEVGGVGTSMQVLLASSPIREALLAQGTCRRR